MAQDRKAVTVHYRRYTGTSTVALEQMIQTAFNAPVAGGPARVKERFRFRVLTDAGDNFFVNTYADRANDGSVTIAFGDIIHFTQGHLQAVLKMTDETSSQLPVTQLPAPSQSEFVHSQMFWLVKGNHVFVIQSQSLKTEVLERYFAWMLARYYPIPVTDLILASKFDTAVIGGDLDDIKEIVIGGAVSGGQSVVASTPSSVESSSALARAEPPTIDPRITEVVQSSELVTRGGTGRDMARGVLEAVLNDDAAAADRVLDSVPEDAELHVRVHIGYKTKKRKLDRTSLKQLEAGLRHVPDSQLSVYTGSTKTSPDGTVRLHYNAAVKLIKARHGDSEIIGSLLDPADAMRAMVDAYAHLLSNGKISEAAG